MWKENKLSQGYSRYSDARCRYLLGDREVWIALGQRMLLVVMFFEYVELVRYQILKVTCQYSICQLIFNL